MNNRRTEKSDKKKRDARICEGIHLFKTHDKMLAI